MAMNQGKGILTLVFIFCSVVATMAQSAAVQPRITQAVDGQKLVRLVGNTHPLAQAQYDRGAVPDSQPMDRMLLLLQRSAEQERALRQLLDEQQTKTSPRYHAWLTAEEFGQQFGPADADIQVVADWLASQGFLGINVSQGKTVIQFTGTAGQVQSAFHTEIHKFLVNGEERNANVSDPQIPAALAPVVAGVASLHNFPRKSYARRLGTFRRTKATGEVSPLFTYPPGGPNLAVGPTDFATIYNLLPLWQATPAIDGTGQKIALVGDSNINPSDVQDFRTMFGLPTSNPFNTPQVIVNGPDPGLNGDEIEADLDVQWAGAIAKNAQIILVVTEPPITAGVAGVDLSALYIIDNNLAPVMSESFGECEANLGTTLNQFESALWQQASAQGITVMVSTGDNGSAGCDDPNTQLVATRGLAVNGIASTPFNVAVGGTDFNSSLPNYVATYWNLVNDPTSQSSAKSYIPEITWNDTCASGGLTTACTATVINSDAQNIFPGVDLVAGSGGPSTVYTKPSWQTGNGVPADGKRDLPDVSLFASNGANGSFYIICQRDANPPKGSATSCDLNSPFQDFQGVGGTSASAPALAAIMALVNQYQASHGGSSRQGNVNYVLYPMAANTGASCSSSPSAVTTAGCIFYDLPAGAGNISVACQGGSKNCSNTSAATNAFGIMTTTAGGTTPAYSTTAGYDLATGLGSVNAANLVTNWAAASFSPSTTTFTLNGGAAVTITHGTAVNVSGTVTAQSGSGTPTGIVELIQGTAFPGPVIDTFTLSGGGYSSTTRMLPGGTSYQVFAHYGGDGTFAASDSPPQTVNSVGKENSAVTVGLVTFTVSGVPVLSTAPATLQYGSPYILRVDVTNSSKQPCSTSATPIPCPTGTVTLLDNGNPLNDFLVPNTNTPTNTAQLNNAGFLEDQPIQLPASAAAQNITASYSGDNSYNAQPNSNVLALTITKATTSLSAITAPTQPVNLNASFALSTTVLTSSNGAAPTGAVTFLDGSTALTGNVTTVPTPGSVNGPASLQVTLTTPLSTPGNHSITATYGGDANYAASEPTAAATVTVVALTVTGPDINFTTPGGSLTSAITVTPLGGFSGTVSFTCGVPADMNEATCIAPQNLTLSGSSNQPAGNLTVTTTAPHIIVGLRRSSRWASFGLMLVGAFLLGISARKRWSGLLLGLVMLGVLAAGIFACGGGGRTAPVQDPGTAAGTYQVTVTAISGGNTVGVGTVKVVVQ